MAARLRSRLLLGALAAGAAVLCAAPGAWAAEPTGRYLVEFERGGTARDAGALAQVLRRTGARKAGRGVPALRIATVRGPTAAIARLRRDPAVKSVSREWARDFRRLPNDPSLRLAEPGPDLPPGTPLQWALSRERFPAAWDITTGPGALVGVVDSGIDGGHPDLAPKIAGATAVGTGSPRTDEDGHGTHVNGLACAATDNNFGVAGAGWSCRLYAVKVGTTFNGGIPDEYIIGGIRAAVDAGVQVVNLSLGGGPPNAALQLTIDDAFNRGVIVVAAASNFTDTDQGAPASIVQPGDASDINAGKGLVVTASDFQDRNAATGRGGQISVAAYGFVDGFQGTDPPGLISTYPSNVTPREQVPELCFCRTAIGTSNDFAYLGGTSMATPQVSGLAALVSSVNPFLTVREKLRMIKQTARRSGGWEPMLGWGIIDAGRAVDAARRVDRRAPSSRARARKRVRVRRGRKRRRVRVRWRGSDPPGAPRLVPSGVRTYDLYMKRNRGRYRRVRRDTRRRSALVRMRPGVYRFYTRAVDRAGNREGKPRRADVRIVVKRPRRRR